LFDKISEYVETPRLELRGMYKISGVLYARILLPDRGEQYTVKKGDTVKNFKVINIDSKQKQVHLVHIHTGQKTTIQHAKPD
jgi:hypothetical protein